MLDVYLLDTMQRTTLALLAATISGALVGSSSSAIAQEPPAAQHKRPADTSSQPEKPRAFSQLVQAGSKAFGTKDYDGALEAFKKAYAIKPLPNLLYNMGRALEKQGDFEGAISRYETFVNEPDVELKARQDALQRLKTLREVLELREEGHQVDREDLAQQQGQQQLAGTPNDQFSPDRVKAVPNYTLAYVFGSVGVASVIASGVFAALAAQQHSDFDEAATLADRREAAHTGRTYNTVADSALAAGVVFTGLGVYFWASPPTENRPDAGARLVPSVGPQGASVVFTLDF